MIRWALLLLVGICTSAQAQFATPVGPVPTPQYVQTYASGFINKFRNGTFDIWQRGTSALATGSSVPGTYTADGWQVAQTGAQGTCAQDTGTAGTLFSLRCVGIASNTDTEFSQPIEAAVATPLAGNVVTTQLWFKQDTGSSVTPKFLTCFASSTNNFSTCTGDISSTSLTACASGTWCSESYTYTVSSSASQGYRVTLDCNTALTSAQHCWITTADTRVTVGATCNGIAPPCVQTHPPAPELRPIASELWFCERYFMSSYGNGVAPGTVTNNGAVFYQGSISGTQTAVSVTTTLPSMRAAPNMTGYSPVTGTSGKFRDFGANADDNVAFGVIGNTAVVIQMNAFTSSSSPNVGVQWTASSEL